MGRKDDVDEFEVEDIGTRMSKHVSGGARASYTIPPSLPIWKPKKSGVHEIDIVPFIVTENSLRYPEEKRYARVGKMYFERTFYTHRGVGINNDTVTCIAMTFGKRCPVCEERNLLNRKADKESSKMAKDLRPKDRQMFLIFDWEDQDKGIQFWEEANWNFGRHLEAHISAARRADQEAYRRFFSPKNGFSMRLNAREATISDDGGKNTEYTVHSFFDRQKDFPADFYRHGHDLDAFVREMDYDTLRKMFHGIAEGEDEPRGGRDPDARSGRNGSLPPREESKSPFRSETTSSNGPSRKPRDEEPDDDVPPPKKATPREERAPAKKGKEPLKFATGDIVSFDRKGEEVQGKVKKIDEEKETCHIELDGVDRLLVYDWTDLTLVESDDTFDLKNPPKEDKAPAKKGSKWDDDGGSDDDDGRAFKRGGKKPPADDDEPAPKKRGR